MEHMTPGKRVGKGPKYTVTSKHHSIILCTHSMARRGAHNAGGGGTRAGVHYSINTSVSIPGISCVQLTWQGAHDRKGRDCPRGGIRYNIYILNTTMSTPGIPCVQIPRRGACNARLRDTIMMGGRGVQGSRYTITYLKHYLLCKYGSRIYLVYRYCGN